MSITIDLGSCTIQLKFDGARHCLQRRYVSGEPDTRICSAEMKALGATGHKSKYFNAERLLVVLRDPVGTIDRHLSQDRPMSSELLFQYRLWLVMMKRLMEVDGDLEGDDLKISAEDFSQMERSLMQSSAPYDPPEEVDATKPIRTRGRRGRRSRKRRRSPSTSDSSDSEASSGPDAPRNSRQIIPLVTDVTDVAAVEGAVVQYTPSYIAEAIPKAVLCGMMSQRVDYPAYLALVTAAYRVISEDVRAAAETIPRKLLTNLIQAQK